MTVWLWPVKDRDISQADYAYLTRKRLIPGR